MRFDLFVAGLLPSDPDTASDAREQRQDQGGAEAGQDDDHRGASHLAVPLRRGMDEDRNVTQRSHHGRLWQEKQVRK